MDNTVKKQKSKIKQALLGDSPVFNQNREMQISAFLTMLYNNISEKEFVNIMQINNDCVENWYIRKKDFSDMYKLYPLYNIHLSVNAFYLPLRGSQNVSSINAVYLDLDYYKTAYRGYSAFEIVSEVEKMDVPTPSFFVDSGRGLHIYWLLKGVRGFEKQINFVKKLEESLITKFAEFGADSQCKDVSRVLKMPGTKNRKNYANVKIILPSCIKEELLEYAEHPIRYDLTEFSDLVWQPKKEEKIIKKEKEPEVKNKPKQKNKETTKITTLKTIKNLHFNRAVDLERLICLRKGNLEGYRNTIMFIYALSMFCSDFTEKNIKNKLNKLNLLDDKEVNYIFESARKNKELLDKLKGEYDKNKDGSLTSFLRKNGVYVYMNSTIIKELNITDEEQKQMTVLISADEKRRRKNQRNKENYKERLNKEGKTTKSEQINDFRQKILDLRTKGLKKNEIISVLSTNESTYRRHYRWLKKNGLL